MSKKYLSMLGLARRAGKLSMGHDMACDAIRKGKARLIVFACDISPRLIREIDDLKDKYKLNVPCVKLEEGMDALYAALGYKAGIIAVNDENFSGRIIELLHQEGNVYGD